MPNFLSSEYNFTVFFSLPFVPLSKMYKKRYINHGHLTVGLGPTAYQLHDPARLRSKFLVSKMPLRSWLFKDGPWHDWDPDSKYYRHVHLFETAEVKRTVVFFGAIKNFPIQKQKVYEDYFESMERDFQDGRLSFSLLQKNCSEAITHVFYREGWFGKMPFDFLPAVSFKRLLASWQRQNVEFTAGCIQQNNDKRFRLQRFCMGISAFAPEIKMNTWFLKKYPPNTIVI